MIAQFLSWYLTVQLIALVALPLTLRLFANLPDRGYTFAKSLGILAVGFVLWLGTSYGLLRNEAGGAWLALLLVAGGSAAVGWPLLRRLFGRRALDASPVRVDWNYVVIVELLFLVAFVGWAFVRAHDPAASHTEQPMDLMFMNGIRSSPTFPPQDPWLAGYAISYYYFGYWLLITLGHLAGTPPEITYNIGQACWFGLLLLGSFGVVCNLLAARAARPADDTMDDATDDFAGEGSPLPLTAVLGGFLGALAVGVIGNLQVILEWLHANGVNISGLARFFDVRDFPDNAAVTGQWYIGLDWWWWRASRVIADQRVDGAHSEVIDEFPIFSYILGDNHPHVLAMPFVLLVIALAWNLVLNALTVASSAPDDVLDVDEPDAAETDAADVPRLGAIVPLGPIGILITVVAVGSLIFLNTWDFPPYWLLLVLCMFTALVWAIRQAIPQLPARAVVQIGLIGAVATAILVPLGALILYFPYFLTAQSQAGGFVPNLLNPTRFPQFLLMFGAFLPALIALILIAWREMRPTRSQLLASGALIYGLPLAFLIISTVLAVDTERGRAALGADLSLIVQRWLGAPFTFLVIGFLLTCVVALVWQRFAQCAAVPDADLVSDEPSVAGGEHATFDPAVQLSRLFVLFLAGIGLALVYAPEFVYLRDNFGSRMNTVFKFYYQAWLLFGLSSAYIISVVFTRGGVGMSARVSRALQPVTVGLAVLSLALMAGGLIYPIAGAYSKTAGFSAEPTFDATAYIARANADEMAAIEWVRHNTTPQTVVLEGKGASYWSTYNRISTATGRPTLLGWDGHQSQWRGRAYGEMAEGRPETLELIYRSGTPEQIEEALTAWDIDYVYVGPTEREQYGVTPRSEERLQTAMELVFTRGDVRIYGRRGAAYSGR